MFPSTLANPKFHSIFMTLFMAASPAPSVEEFDQSNEINCTMNLERKYHGETETTYKMKEKQYFYI